MKLRRLYCNRPDIRPPIEFHDGLNVVIGEIRKPENRDADTHNLGKTLLCRLIDFCLLNKKDSKSFLFKNAAFEDFVFFLEVQPHAGGAVTIRRSVREASKVSFLSHAPTTELFDDLPPEKWSHRDVSFARARNLLDGLLDLRALTPWDYRDAIGYALRTQQDFDQPFKLIKYAGKHAEWKPFLAHMLGLDGRKVAQGYELQDDTEAVEGEIRRLAADVAGVAESADQLRGLIAIRRRDVEADERRLDDYDFELTDAEIDRDLVDRLDRRIAELNELRYYRNSDRQRILSALEAELSFDLRKLAALFEDAKVYFGEQVRRDYGDLEKFNREITVERNEYLREELDAVAATLQEIAPELENLNRERSSALAALREKETVSKFKRISKRLVEKRTALDVLHHKQKTLEKLAELRKRHAELTRERDVLVQELDAHLTDENPVYEEIRSHFDDIVFQVVAQHANLYTALNNKGNIEFRVNMVDDDGRETAAGDGHSYGRLLCLAFDLAVIRAHLEVPYPHFVYHDGALETLDPRKRLNLIEVLRSYAVAGVQHIITVIDSELPRDERGSSFEFTADEIVLRLHDEGEGGLLFRMPPW